MLFVTFAQSDPIELIKINFDWTNLTDKQVEAAALQRWEAERSADKQPARATSFNGEQGEGKPGKTFWRQSKFVLRFAVVKLFWLFSHFFNYF